MPLPIGLLAGLGSIIGAGLSGGLAGKSQKRANEQNLALAKYQYSKDLEMWNRQNQYNLPDAQMERLKNAGLNPNMVYGQGTVAGNTSGTMPKFNAPTMQPNPTPDFSGTLGDFTNTLVRNAQVKNLQSTTDLNDLKGANEIIRGNILTEDAKKRGINNRILEQTEAYQTEAIEQKARQERQKALNLIGIGDEIKSRTDLNKAKKVFEDYKNELAEQGIHTTDNILFRQAFVLWKKWGGKLTDYIEQARQKPANLKFKY